MKLWIDDVRPAPEGYVWCKSVNQAILRIQTYEQQRATHIKAMQDADSLGDYETGNKVCAAILDNTLTVIDIDHDAGDYACDGGDYIQLLNWLEETGRNYPIHIHSMNPVGIENMRAIIRRNGWKEINQNIESYAMIHTPPTGKENMRRIIQRNKWKEV